MYGLCLFSVKYGVGGDAGAPVGPCVGPCVGPSVGLCVGPEVGNLRLKFSRLTSVCLVTLLL